MDDLYCRPRLEVVPAHDTHSTLMRGDFYTTGPVILIVIPSCSTRWDSTISAYWFYWSILVTHQPLLPNHRAGVPAAHGALGVGLKERHPGSQGIE